MEFKDTGGRLQQLQVINRRCLALSQQLYSAQSVSLTFHDPVQVDLAFSANSRTITRLMDAWWECKVNASIGLLTLCDTRTACRSPSNAQTY
jgi:hypothetical protein